MNIVLHIGLEKTGTTTIQQFLGSNRAALEGHGILFPASPGGTNQTKLTAYALAGDQPDSVLRKHTAGIDHDTFRRRFREAFKTEVRSSSCSEMVLSNEHCSSRLRTVEEIRRLKALLDELGTVRHVIIYLRRQDDFLLSSYSTAVKNGMVAPFSLPRERKLAGRYDFRLIIDRWSTVFGEEAMRPRIFAPEDFLQGDLLADFCATAGIPPLTISEAPSVRNVSLSAEGLEMLRLLNAAVSRDKRQGPAQRDIVRRVERAAPGPKLSLSGAARRKFMTAFDASNEEIRRRFFPERSTLFAPVDDTAPEVPLPAIGLERAMEISATMLRADPPAERKRGLRIPAI